MSCWFLYVNLLHPCTISLLSLHWTYFCRLCLLGLSIKTFDFRIPWHAVRNLLLLKPSATFMMYDGKWDDWHRWAAELELFEGSGCAFFFLEHLLQDWLGYISLLFHLFFLFFVCFSELILVQLGFSIASTGFKYCIL